MSESAREPRNRSDFIAMLEDLRQRGLIDMADEGMVIRHYDDLAESLAEDKQRLFVEYEQRCATEGREAADAWLAAQARELGRRYRESLGEVMSRCDGLKDSLPNN